MKRLLDIDPDTGRREIFHFDESTQKCHIEYQEDVEAAIECNKNRQTSGHDGYTQSRDLRHVAHIPDIIVLKWLKEDGINFFDKNHWPAIKRKLRDPDWMYLRTIPGKGV